MMIRRILGTILLAFVLAVIGFSQSSSPRVIATRIAKAYPVSLVPLDNSRLLNGGIKVVVENSISEKISVYRFRSFRETERWLKRNRRADGTPIRQSRDISLCSKVRCSFDFNGGILHNHLYLKSLVFGYRGGRRYLKEIRLLDGA